MTDPVIANKKTYWESNGQITRQVLTGEATDLSWETAFQKDHGRLPTEADRADRDWSLEFYRTNGRPPTDDEWKVHAQS
jgi:hypothetical protein